MLLLSQETRNGSAIGLGGSTRFAPASALPDGVSRLLRSWRRFLAILMRALAVPAA